MPFVAPVGAVQEEASISARARETAGTGYSNAGNEVHRNPTLARPLREGDLDQLGENLDWSERSTYEDSEDVATSGDVILHFAAAVKHLPLWTTG